jgi:anti-sigma factor RsiW
MTGTDSASDLACQEFVELITDYLDGVLPLQATAAVERHLAECTGCAGYLDQMRATIRELGYLPVESLTTRARDELLAAFRDLTPTPRSERT